MNDGMNALINQKVWVDHIQNVLKFLLYRLHCRSWLVLHDAE